MRWRLHFNFVSTFPGSDHLGGLLEGGEAKYEKYCDTRQQQKEERNVFFADLLLSPFGGIPIAGGFIGQAVTATIKRGIHTLSESYEQDITLRKARDTQNFEDLLENKDGPRSLGNTYCSAVLAVVK